MHTHANTHTPTYKHHTHKHTLAHTLTDIQTHTLLPFLASPSGWAYASVSKTSRHELNTQTQNNLVTIRCIITEACAVSIDTHTPTNEHTTKLSISLVFGSDAECGYNDVPGRAVIT